MRVAPPAGSELPAAPRAAAVGVPAVVAVIGPRTAAADALLAEQDLLSS